MILSHNLGPEECKDCGASACDCKVRESTQYKELCKTVVVFASAKGLDEKSCDQLATLIALAIRIGQSLPPNL